MTNLASSIQVSEEMISAGIEIYDGPNCALGRHWKVEKVEQIYLAMRSKDHSIAGDDVRLDQGKIAEIIAHSMGRYPTDDPVLDATMAVIAYVNGPRLAAITAIGSPGNGK